MTTDNTKNNDRYTINTIEKALDLLELLAEKESLNLLELAELTNRPKSSLFRIITTLENRGYITRSESNDKYCLGIKILDLSKKFLESNNIRHAALAEMNGLLDKYGESVNLGILKDGEITYVEVLEGTHQLRFKDEVGSKAPFHATAMGKVILAYLSDEEMNQFLQQENMAAFTPYTIVNLAELKKQLPEIKKVGYAVDTQENVLGVKCIAAPIFNMYGKVDAAISLSGTIHRINDGNIDAISKDVVFAAKNISRKMGFTRNST